MRFPTWLRSLLGKRRADPARKVFLEHEADAITRLARVTHRPEAEIRNELRRREQRLRMNVYRRPEHR